MEIGVGLPAAVCGVVGDQLLDWARYADQAEFSSLATLDRLVYGNCESLIALAASAGVTRRIRLAATVLLAPYRGNPALLAKQLSTLDRISEGRLVAGLAAGGREDDFIAADLPYARRGRTLDSAVERMVSIWSGAEPDGRIGPSPYRGSPPLIFGGHTDIAIRRAARYGQGWISGGSSASGYRELAERARRGWAAEGRLDQPRLLALAYFALGPQGTELARRYVGEYYAFLGERATDRITKGVLTDPVRVREAVAAYADAGCTELILMPCSAELSQLELLDGAVH
ncbi:LLM class flavin-dependent oxidoreductase [Amycolatopsis coloradensis]|uniref:LLM class flavin-dependent oxidoreductase n=1 Tax=Amycolatopsis coloradensis TaxID=76021 RepID=A0ACD5BJY0_9PSEU